MKVILHVTSISRDREDTYTTYSLAGDRSDALDLHFMDDEQPEWGIGDRIELSFSNLGKISAKSRKLKEGK